MFAQCPTVGNTVTVTTTNPTGTGSLANAITCANTTTNITNIVFNIPGAGSKLIRPTSALPTLSKAGASIDGNTQGSTVILDGTGKVVQCIEGPASVSSISTAVESALKAGK